MTSQNLCMQWQYWLDTSPLSSSFSSKSSQKLHAGFRKAFLNNSKLISVLDLAMRAYGLCAVPLHSRRPNLSLVESTLIYQCPFLLHSKDKDNPDHEAGRPWKHFLAHWPFRRGIHQSLLDSPHKGIAKHSFHVFFNTSLFQLLNKQSSCYNLTCHDSNEAPM